MEMSDLRQAGAMMIECYGTTGSLIRTEQTEDPAKPWESSSSETICDVRFLMTEFSRQEKDGSRVRRGDKRLLLSPADLSLTPMPGDKVTDESGLLWRVVDVKEVRPGRVGLLYLLHVRQ